MDRTAITTNPLSYSSRPTRVIVLPSIFCCRENLKILGNVKATHICATKRNYVVNIMRNTRLLSKPTRLTINDTYSHHVRPRRGGLFYMLFPCASPGVVYAFISLVMTPSDCPHFICVFSAPISIERLDVIGVLCVVDGIVVFTLFWVFCVISRLAFSKAQDTGAIVRAAGRDMLVFAGSASEIRSST